MRSRNSICSHVGAWHGIETLALPKPERPGSASGDVTNGQWSQQLRGCCVLQSLQLTSLRTLDMSNTCLSSIPPGITALKALRELQLGACSFKSIPADLLRQLEALRALDLSRNAELELQQLSHEDLAWLATGALTRGWAFLPCGGDSSDETPIGSMCLLTFPGCLYHVVGAPW